MLGKLLTDDGLPWLLKAVAGRKVAPVQQWNMHCLEVPGACSPELDRMRLAIRCWPVFDVHGGHEEESRHEPVECSARRHHTRNRANALENPCNQVGACCFRRVCGGRQTQLRGQD